MMNKNFDQDSCSKCGKCALNCPVGIIQMNEFPEMPEESFCIQCGHCEAICAEGAIRMINSSKGNVSYLGQGIISPEQIGFQMKFRRSIRHYQDKPVEKETLKELFDIVRYAPSAVNGQPVEWNVFNDHNQVKEIAGAAVSWMKHMVEKGFLLNGEMTFDSMVEAWDNGMDPILRNAPCLVVAHAHEDNMMAHTDGIIALTHLDLVLPSFGLGGCWAGLLNIAYNQHPPLKEILGIPPENTMIYPFMLGYPKYQYHGIPGRNKAKITWK